MEKNPTSPCALNLKEKLHHSRLAQQEVDRLGRMELQSSDQIQKEECQSWEHHTAMMLYLLQGVGSRINSAFIPKVSTQFYRLQEIVPLSFPPKPSHLSEELWIASELSRLNAQSLILYLISSNSQGQESLKDFSFKMNQMEQWRSIQSKEVDSSFNEPGSLSEA